MWGVQTHDTGFVFSSDSSVFYWVIVGYNGLWWVIAAYGGLCYGGLWLAGCELLAVLAIQ